MELYAKLVLGLFRLVTESTLSIGLQPQSRSQHPPEQRAWRVNT